MPRGRKKKNEFEDLPEDYRSMMAGSKDDKINEEIRNSALYMERLRELKKEDQDLANKKEVYEEAGKVYKEGTKQCKLKIAYNRAILRGRGRQLPGD